MGKTLKRQRRKEAQAGSAQQPGPRSGKKPKGAGHVQLVTQALDERRWDEACAQCHSMRRAGEVPPLGAVQRWVRMADLCGDEAIVARVVGAILLALPGARGPIASLPHASAAASTTGRPTRAGQTASGGPAGHKLSEAGPIRRHPPWRPALTQQQQQQQQQPPQPQQPPAAQHPHDVPPAAAREGDHAQHDGLDARPGAGLPPTPAAGPCAPGPAASSNSSGAPAHRDASWYRSRCRLVAQDASTLPAKRPAQWQELRIWRAEPGTITWDAGSTPHACARVDVPSVPGAFVLRGLLSPGECAQLVAATEAMGYAWDVDYTFNPSQPSATAADDPSRSSDPGEHATHPTGQGMQPAQQQEQQQRPAQQYQAGARAEAQETSDSRHHHHHQQQQQQQQHSSLAGSQENSLQRLPAEHPLQRPPDALHPLLSAARTAAGGDRAAGCVWLADDSLLGELFRRAAPLLPRQLCGGTLAGLNARLRFYRYDQGNVYRPHVDGAWPGSGLQDGKLVHDAFADRWSRLTFLVYLNDNFTGGSTTFFTPAADDASALDAWGVQPATGNVLCFPHGDTAGSLVHEGSAVLQGAKYVIRTDVLYMLSPSSAHGGKPGRAKAG